MAEFSSDPMCLMISLPRAVARRAAMAPRVAALPFAVEVMDGVDGAARWDELRQTVDIPAFRRNTGREVMPGEIGCYHAHLAAWRRLLDSGAEVGLILEDDVVFHDDFAEAVRAAMEARDAWEFLKLNRIRARGPICQGRIGRWRLNAYLGPATGLGAYMIRRDLIARLLPGMLPVTRPIDHELDRIHVHDFRHFGLEPFPSHVDDAGVSTITGDRFAAVRRFPWYRRLPVHGVRLANLVGKAAYLARMGRLIPRHGAVDAGGPTG
jgi:glycosyl transferase family 25